MGIAVPASQLESNHDSQSSHHGPNMSDTNCGADLPPTRHNPTLAAAPPHPAVANILRPASATFAGMSRALRPLAVTAGRHRDRPASATFGDQAARKALVLPPRRGSGAAVWDNEGACRSGRVGREELLLEREICALQREAESVRNENLRLLTGAVSGDTLAAAAAAAGVHALKGLSPESSPETTAAIMGAAAVAAGRSGSGWTPSRSRPAPAARPRSGLLRNLEPLK